MIVHIWSPRGQREIQPPHLNKMFWEELITFLPLIQKGLHRKWRLQQFFLAAETNFLSCYPSTIGKYTDSPFIRHGPHRKWHVIQVFHFCVNQASAWQRKEGYTLYIWQYQQIYGCWMNVRYVIGPRMSKYSFVSNKEWHSVKSNGL
jgi:hypothetical protein